MNKAINFIKNNIRYFFVIMVLVLFFFINRAFPADVITSESCAGGKCPMVLVTPQLTDEQPFYFANDIFKSTAKEYYRLTFQTKTSADSKISVKITNPLNEEKEIKNLDLSRFKESEFQEMLFSTNDNQNYTDLLFEKLDKNDGAEISITGIQITKLNITSDKEFASFKPTIKGDVDYNVSLLDQLVSSYGFDQLNDPDIILGQIFKSPADYITEIVLNLDIIKQSNNQGKKYDLDLREINYEEDGPPEIRSITLASLEFSITDLDKYRQSDGKYKFPLFARVEKGKYYFFGLDNQKTEPNQYNYLSLKGNRDSEGYSEGSVVVKTKGESYSAVGDLYFKIFGIKFTKYNGKKVLGGTVISDIGKSKGTFKYQPKNNIYDLADLDSYSRDIYYDTDKKALVGTNIENKESSLIYKFETIFPFTQFRIFAKQADINWSEISISYSFDKDEWIEIQPRNV